MSVANLNNLGQFLGLYELQTPSGQLIRITRQQEAQIAQRALEWKLEQDLMAGERLKQTAIEAGIGAIGTAVGFAIGGIAIGTILGKVLGISIRR